MKSLLTTLSIASLLNFQIIPIQKTEPTATQSLETTSAQRAIKSVDVMKESRDRLCHPRSEDEVASIISRIADLGATHVALPLFVEAPACTNTMDHFDLWVTHIRAHNMNVWYRLSTLEWEGFYETSKKVDPAGHSQSIAEFARIHPRLFVKGDLITPQPEPQNAGIKGVNCFDNNCMFNSAKDFNQWLVDTKQKVEASLAENSISGVEVGYYGFDGYIAWGDDNPDWSGIISPETAKSIGPITIDHYFSTSDDPRSEFLKPIEKFANQEICIGEWGAIHDESSTRVRQIFQALLDHNVSCFNYWHAGPSGTSEALLNHDFTPKPLYYDVQWFFGQF